MVLTTISVRAAPAPRAVASSPSGCARRWNAVGAIRTGIETSVPSTVVLVSVWVTSTSTRGRRKTSAKAPRLAASVSSSSAPPA
jgi:hypothetical protein